MATNNEIKHVRQLHQKKYRQQFGQFLVEGQKMVSELIQSDFTVDQIYFSGECTINASPVEPVKVSAEQMRRMSTLKTPPGILAVVQIPGQGVKKDFIGYSVVLDQLRDPGNLGTILRIADWFGVSRVVASEDSVEAFSPKVVQASMGSIFRIPYHTADLSEWLLEARANEMPIISAEMTGTKLSDFEFPKSGVLLMGSESHGVSESLRPLIDERITISRKGRAESLNVAVALGVIASRLPL